MENQIIEILKQIQSEQVKTNERLGKLEEGQIKLQDGQDRIEKKIDAVYEQTADLTGFRTETKQSIDALRKDINAVINVTKSNCYDITYLKSAK